MKDSLVSVQDTLAHHADAVLSKTASILTGTPVESAKTTELWNTLIDSAVNLGERILAAIAIYIIGRWIIKLIKKVNARMMERRKLDPAVKSFLGSLINITLTILLLIAVIGALGIETTSFAALLAAAGVAIGAALSGNLQNFAGGLMILLFKPYRIGDYIDAQGQSGTVQEIQIFHTLLTTPDNKTIFLPNGAVSSGALTNYSHQAIRRVDWTVDIEYGEAYEKAKDAIEKLLLADPRILKDPAHFIALGALKDSSVSLTVRVWVKSEDYWGVYFDFNQKVYAYFNQIGISFPFPQLTVHPA